MGKPGEVEARVEQCPPDREHRAGDDLVDFLIAQIRVAQQADASLGHFAQVVRRNLGCHPDGNADGRVWNQPEGLRKTTALFGMAHTHPLHYSADRDEVQDFEYTIRGRLMQATEPGTMAEGRNDWQWQVGQATHERKAAEAPVLTGLGTDGPG